MTILAVPVRPLAEDVVTLRARKPCPAHPDTGQISDDMPYIRRARG